jgi:tetratricopeptide (TPR) repeat protein
MPRPVPGVDMKALPIGPEEAFVLSRVDGNTPESAIALATGLDPARVAVALSKLSELGAVTFNGSGSSTASPAASSAASGARAVPVEVASQDGTARSQPPRQKRLPPAIYDPLELDEEADLDPERKRAILDAYYRLNGIDHYQLLEVEPSAEKKEIKRAYYDAVAIFHPDKYFGKHLGNFKPKLEKIFAQMTEAHDVLTRKRSRAEYDEYLANQRKTRALEEYLANFDSATAGADETEPRPLELASTPPTPPAESDPTAPRAAPEPRPVAPENVHITEKGDPRATSRRPPTPGPRRPPSGPMLHDSEARRRALVRKLASRSSAPPPRGSAPPPVDSEAAQSAAAEALKHRYDHRTAQAKQAQLDRYLAAAAESEAAGNAVGAANALRIAVALSPDDETLKQRLDAAQDQASAELAETYFAQARYEEQNFHYEAAARSYARAAAGKASAQLYQQAANCYLEAGSDPRSATEHARKAVSLAPTNAEARITLARAYLASNMRQSALAELERAAAQDPTNDAVKQHIKRVKRGRA